MTTSLIKLVDLSYGYTQERAVLDSLSFSLATDERTCITGPNGSGKSTLLQLIMGLVVPSRGTIEIFGKRREKEADFKEIRGEVGLLFQDSDVQLFCPTVFDDVAFGPLNLGKSKEETRAVVEQTLETLHLSEYADRITYQLSYGEKRLIALASILAMEPRVLLLDEPTAGLDTRHEERLTKILMELPQEMIIISHNDAFMNRVATRTVYLENGRIAESHPLMPSD